MKTIAKIIIVAVILLMISILPLIKGSDTSIGINGRYISQDLNHTLEVNRDDVVFDGESGEIKYNKNKFIITINNNKYEGFYNNDTIEIIIQDKNIIFKN